MANFPGNNALESRPVVGMDTVTGRIDNINSSLSANLVRIEAAIFRLTGNGHGEEKEPQPRPTPAGHLGKIAELLSTAEAISNRLALAADSLEKAV